mmetsp:Transcript_76127/g.120219  ORF Transcript_76127/g.120219 Transcript_76127/m.120219 type:complete len:229 (-) Transcript_76127:505-1191(-)
MLLSRAAISSFVVAIVSFKSAMTVARSARECSRPFFLSSAWSNAFAQYSFLLSSSDCSTFKVATMSSIILITFSKPIFLPWIARAMKSKWWRSNFESICTLRIKANALVRAVPELVSTCIKLAAALGSVFLNNSSASSSLSILMVSASARSSSFRVFTISAHSSDLVLQFFSRSARNFLSSTRASAVSPRSFFISTISTASSPARCVFSSMAFVNAFTSFAFAAISSS